MTCPVPKVCKLDIWTVYSPRQREESLLSSLTFGKSLSVIGTFECLSLHGGGIVLGVPDLEPKKGLTAIPGPKRTQ